MPYCKLLLSLAAASLLAGQTQAPPPESDANQQVVAIVDGREITKAEVDAILYIAPPDFQNYYRTSPREALTTWFVLNHLGDLAIERGLDKRSPTKEQLDHIFHDILARAMVNEEENAYPVTNEMVDAYYESHRDRYQETTLKGIVITFQTQTQGTSPEDLAAIARSLVEKRRSEADAKEMALDIVRRLREGADFAKFVEQYSEDPDSKARGGDLPPIHADSALPAEFREAVARIEKGEVSDPLRQPGSFYIVRVEDRRLAPVESVRGEIVMAIRREHRDSWLTQINRRYQVEVKDQDFFQPKMPGFNLGAPGQQ